jgi:exonuclease VII large subunit
MTGGAFLEGNDRPTPASANVNTFYLNKTNAIDDLSKENVVRHLEEILDQNRKDTAEMKIRLERELEDLIKREKNDARELQELENKCNELVIQNRNVKFELDRTTTEHQQMERDQEMHMRLHEEKIREANK